jgi:hypothetical protein
MTSIFFHPATAQLLRLQSRGRRRRIWRRFCQPRRLVLSAIACALAVVWIGNAAMTVWLRDSAAPETLRALLSLGLLLYAGWHVAKAAFFRPENPFDSSPGEREIFASTPLRPCDLVGYQLASVTVTTFVKSALFTLLLLPDLHCLPLGLVGVSLAMVTLELLRMAVDITAWGMSRAAFLVYRALVVAALLAAGVGGGGVIVHSGALAGPLYVGQGLSLPVLDIVLQLNASAIGLAVLPFLPLVDLTLADSLTPAAAIRAVAALAVVSALAAGVVLLYAATVRRVAVREKRGYRLAVHAPELASSAAGSREPSPTAVPLRIEWRIPRCGGAGALAWRQLIGARRRAGSLLTAMIAPAVLACTPCFVISDAFVALLATAGTLAFYTFLLLPTALRFDFRRDLDRLTTFKALPITPAALVIGQTLPPALIATLFQSVLLAFAILMRSLPPHLWFGVMLVMAPLNVLVFGLENLIYLLYPYRVQQEGLEIFVRTMLNFTGKGLLFTVGLIAVSAWGFAAADVAHAFSSLGGGTVSAASVFTAGMSVGPTLLAALVLCILCRTFRNLDAAEDIPR